MNASNNCPYKPPNHVSFELASRGASSLAMAIAFGLALFSVLYFDHQFLRGETIPIKSPFEAIFLFGLAATYAYLANGCWKLVRRIKLRQYRSTIIGVVLGSLIHVWGIYLLLTFVREVTFFNPHDYLPIVRYAYVFCVFTTFAIASVEIDVFVSRLLNR